ncbi:MAG: Lcl domain-containing protein [Candidatus Moraniibacteriota bacterium]
MKKIIDFLKFKKSGKIKFALGVVVGIGVGIVIGGYFIAYAQQFIDSFLDTSRVANTWNVEVDTANGEVKLAQRSCDNTVWFCDLTWRCPGLMGDGNGLLVKREDNYAQWKIWGNACDTPQCSIDGAQTDNLVADNTVDFSAYYPARQACKAAGGRLPTVAELQCIYAYRGTYGTSFVNDYYWTSQESTNAGYTWILYGYNGGVYEDPKTNSRRLRCVRGW